MNIKSWKTKSKQVKTEIVALYLASKHPGTPWYAKVLAALVIGYALSPIDLIPDFIPGVGYLDDLILVPAGIALLIKIVPKDILEECRAKAQSDLSNGKPKNWVAAIIIVLIWLLAIYLILSLIWPVVSKAARTEDHPPFFRSSLILRSPTVSMSLKGCRVWTVSPSCVRSSSVFSKTLSVLHRIPSKTRGEKVLSLKPIR
jgi:uncharacterized membrane protein YkvA (DUF1232 family)